jgi:hypothetical protein
MWSGSRRVLALAAWLTLGACSGGYPLAPTRCDEFCDATKGDSCPEFYDPAGCVSNCERSHTAPAQCRAELDGVIACFHAHPEALEQRCSYIYGATPACSAEVYSLSACANPPPYGGGPTPP